MCVCVPVCWRFTEWSTALKLEAWHKHILVAEDVHLGTNFNCLKTELICSVSDRFFASNFRKIY